MDARMELFEEAGYVLDSAEVARMRADTARAFAFGLTSGSCRTWLAIGPRGELAGTCVLNVLDRLPSPPNPCPQEGYVTHLHTHRDWRRRGVATALMAAALDEARRRGLARVRLHSTQSGRAFYLQAGFRLRTDDMEIYLDAKGGEAPRS